MNCTLKQSLCNFRKVIKLLVFDKSCFTLMYLKLFTFLLIIHKQMLMSRILVSDQGKRRLSIKSDKSKVGVFFSRQLDLISF